jgi:NCS1 family nucleobase:cation symporter-1
MKTKSLVEYLQVPSDERHVASIWINDDIRPLPPRRRKWDRVAFLSFQMINQVCISNRQVGASLVAVGLSVWQTMIAVIVGKIIVSLVTVYNGYIGAEWHIGFPVLSRFVWGIYG